MEDTPQPVTPPKSDKSAPAAPRAYRAVFFDLDGTLLPMDIDAFLKAYFAGIVRYVAARGLDAQAFQAGLGRGTRAMMSHDIGEVNADAFWGEFFEHVDEQAADWHAVCDGYYATEFGDIGADVRPSEPMVRAVHALGEKGYPLLLTTMPLFPPRAVAWRLAWAGLSPDLFARVTAYDNSTAIKPQLAYYAENLAACGVAGSDVLMVGNNTVEDMAVTKLGADIFLVTDYLLDPVPGGFDLASVKHGTAEQFAAWVDELPVCANPVGGADEGVISAEAREAALEANAVDAADAEGPADPTPAPTASDAASPTPAPEGVSA
ncbi:HAD family hydrolase [Adlercreutzia sp. ZJ242]|uniref:HAD family hydrolase n=1 Tax=Adlercreutzia sp. ZJ242 TaxID=2709409 RepID=UPI0013EB33B7|nr:HAD family hydrolase [Adlercreutzia sp. ZJ242]